MEYKYDVAFSFAGEDREYVEEVASILKNKGVKIFYDKFEEVDLWGKDLGVHFEYVYNRSARYCVPFMSESYKKKMWTKYEIRNAISRAINSNEEYILPVKLEDVKIDGLRESIGYLSARDLSPTELANKILEKLGSPQINSVVEEEQEVDNEASLAANMVFRQYGKDDVPEPCLRFVMVNKIDAVRFYNQPYFKIILEDGEEKAFYLTDNYEKHQFPVKLEYGAPLDIAFKLVKGVFERIKAVPNSKIRAEITTTLGERFKSNEVLVSEINKIWDIDMNK